MSEMLNGLRAGGATMVLVTHNVGEGLGVASHAAVMLGGKMVRFGSATGIDAADFAREYRELVVARDAEEPMAVA